MASHTNCFKMLPLIGNLHWLQYKSEYNSQYSESMILLSSPSLQIVLTLLWCLQLILGHLYVLIDSLSKMMKNIKVILVAFYKGKAFSEYYYTLNSQHHQTFLTCLLLVSSNSELYKKFFFEVSPCLGNTIWVSGHTENVPEFELPERGECWWSGSAHELTQLCVKLCWVRTARDVSLEIRAANEMKI